MYCDILSRELRTIIEEKIAEIEREYQQIQGLILTEGDLKCLLYGKLSQVRWLAQPTDTEDPGIRANCVHTEVSFYDERGHLAIKPDITILEPQHLSILHGRGYRVRLPSKQFQFGGRTIVFELKFIRNKNGINKTMFRKIREDYNKIQRLVATMDSQGMPNDVFCYLVIFNKTNRKCAQFTRLIKEENKESNRHKIIYATGKVDLGEKRRIYGRNTYPSAGKKSAKRFSPRI